MNAVGFPGLEPIDKADVWIQTYLIEALQFPLTVTGTTLYCVCYRSLNVYPSLTLCHCSPPASSALSPLRSYVQQKLLILHSASTLAFLDLSLPKVLGPPLPSGLCLFCHSTFPSFCVSPPFQNLHPPLLLFIIPSLCSSQLQTRTNPLSVFTSDLPSPSGSFYTVLFWRGPPLVWPRLYKLEACVSKLLQ